MANEDPRRSLLSRLFPTLIKHPRDGAKAAGAFSIAALSRNPAVMVDWFAEIFFFVGVLGTLLAGLAAGLADGWASGVRVLAFALLLGAASGVCAWLLGLLFGIPRSLARPQPAPQSATPNQGLSSMGGFAPPSPLTDTALLSSSKMPTSRVNTNLEDVSDWLTKTLVGLGLTQITVMPGFLWAAAGAANKSGFVWEPHGQLLALCLFLYFGAGGFWLGYVNTRTMLTALLDLFDNGVGGLPSPEVSRAGSPETVQLEADGRTIRSDPSLKPTDAKLLSAQRSSLRSPVELMAWGAAQARAGNLQESRAALETAREMLPENQELAQVLATVYVAGQDRSKAAPLIAQAPLTPITVLNALYEEPPDGFTKAIAIGEALAANARYEKNANLFVWLACAYGQKLSEQKKNEITKEQQAATRGKVLENVRRALALDPSTKASLRSFWQPQPGSPDDDLEVMGREDAEMVKLLD